MPLSVEVGTLEAGRLPIILGGELDQSTAGRLRDAVRAALQLRPTTLCLDFARVAFMDSSGLGTIVSAKRWCDEIGCSLRLEALSPTIHHRFQISGLIEVFGLPTRPARPCE